MGVGYIITFIVGSSLQFFNTKCTYFQVMTEDVVRRLSMDPKAGMNCHATSLLENDKVYTCFTS